MIVEPVIKGVVAKTAHPIGCEKSVVDQINYIKSQPAIQNAPKRVLILGASSGFGLSSRIALTFAGNADTIGVSFERCPSEGKTGSAGWYNNAAFKKHAEENGRIAVNIQGDAFSDDIRDQVVEAIETYFEGEVDLVVYSLASGVRPKPDGEGMWRSCIKPINASYKANTICLENNEWQSHTLQPASNDEIESTVKSWEVKTGKAGLIP